MSYDLVFWRQPPDANNDPIQLWEALNDNKSCESIETIPKDKILARLAEKYPQSNHQEWKITTEHSSVDYFASEKYFCFMVYGAVSAELNGIIEVMESFGCCLYDPQLSQRYPLGKAPKFEMFSAKQWEEREHLRRQIFDGTFDPFKRDRIGILVFFGAILVSVFYGIVRFFFR